MKLAEATKKKSKAGPRPAPKVGDIIVRKQDYMMKYDNYVIKKIDKEAGTVATTGGTYPYNSLFHKGREKWRGKNKNFYFVRGEN